MRIVSYNVNGIRANIRKGMLDWMEEDKGDVFCLQEVKAMEDDVDLEPIQEMGYSIYWAAAEKKGYSGVAILSREPLQNVVMGNGFVESDTEGRWIEAVLPSGETLINIYAPSGTSGSLRQEYKYQWLDEAWGLWQTRLEAGERMIITGDFNIAHLDIDIHNPKGNQKTSGFLPEERAWVSSILEGGLVDSYRSLYPEKADMYSWWSYRAAAKSRNKGWRIDYIMLSADLESQLKKAGMVTELPYSDHCPIYIEL